MTVSSPLLHPAHLVIQRSLSQIGFSLLFAAAEDVVLHRVGAQLRVMAQIADGWRRSAGASVRELGPAEPGRTAVGSLTEAKHGPASIFHRPPGR